MSPLLRIVTSLFMPVCLLIWTAVPSAAAPPVPLQDALRENLVEAQVSGQSISFTEPMLDMVLENVSSDVLTVTAQVGLELRSEDPAYADVVIARESTVTLRAGESKSVPLYTFSLDLRKSFPPAEVHYHVHKTLADAELLEVLDRIGRERAEESLAAQLAVWMQYLALDYEAVEESLGVALEQYREDALRLLGQVAASPTPIGTLTSTPIGTPAVEEVTPEAVPSPTAAPTTITKGLLSGLLALGVAVVLALGAAIGFVLWRTRKSASVSPPIRHKAEPRIPEVERTPVQPVEETCLGCGRPLSQCTCPVAAAPVPTPVRLTERVRVPLPLAYKKTAILRTGPRLVAVEGECQGDEFFLPRHDSALLSRAELPILVIPDERISAPHALVIWTQDGYQLKDLNSSNGTTINGMAASVSSKQAPEERLLVMKQGVSVAFGTVPFTFDETKAVLQGEKGETYKLPPGGRVIISRERLPFLLLKDRTASSPHALLRREEEDGYTVKDLNSGNGTEIGVPGRRGYDYRYLEGTERVSLSAGKRLRLGLAVLEMRALAGPMPAERIISRLGPYRMLRPIGQGGMARVFEAQDGRGQRLVVKVPRDIYAYNESFRKRFEREARNMQKLEHPNIVSVIDVGEDREGSYLVGDMGLQYIAMDYIDGCSLERLILQQEGQPLDERVVVEVIRCVAFALQHAHEHHEHKDKVIHRDVKPSNVLIDRQGHVFLTDFGIARAVGDATITRPDERPGAPHYMSPEQAAGKAVDAPSDIYSLGVTMYQMLTGRVPFNSDTPVQHILNKHISEAPVPIEEIRPDVSKDLAAIAMRCLEKNPADRHQTAQEIVQALPSCPAANDLLASLVERACQQSQNTNLAQGG